MAQSVVSNFGVKGPGFRTPNPAAYYPKSYNQMYVFGFSLRGLGITMRLKIAQSRH